jgi:hypothetical protein
MLKAVVRAADLPGPVRDEFQNLHYEIGMRFCPGVDRLQLAGMAVLDALSGPLVEFVSGGRHGVRNPVGRAFAPLRGALEGEGRYAGLRVRERYLDLLGRRGWSVPGRVPGMGRGYADGTGPALVAETDAEYRRVFAAAFPGGYSFPRAACPPVELADFAARSAAEAFERASGRRASGEGVLVADPFPGTGLHLSRLIALGLLGSGAELLDKYRGGAVTFATDPMSYHLSCMNVQEAFRGAMGTEMPDVPFEGVCLGDPQDLAGDMNPLDASPLSENSRRVLELGMRPAHIASGTPPFPADGWPRGVPHPDPPKSPIAPWSGWSPAEATARALAWCYVSLDRSAGAAAVTTCSGWALGNALPETRAVLERGFRTVRVLGFRGDRRRRGSRAFANEGQGIMGSGRTAGGTALTVLARGLTGPGEILSASLARRRLADWKLGFLDGARHVYDPAITWKPSLREGLGPRSSSRWMPGDTEAGAPGAAGGDRSGAGGTGTAGKVGAARKVRPSVTVKPRRDSGPEDGGTRG